MMAVRGLRPMESVLDLTLYMLGKHSFGNKDTRFLYRKQQMRSLICMQEHSIDLLQLLIQSCPLISVVFIGRRRCVTSLFI